MDKTRVLLFGMTGYGNGALRALLLMPDVVLAGVFTPEEPEGPHPYYPCEKLGAEARRGGVEHYEGMDPGSADTRALIARLAPDLIVVSSFSRIIPREVISIPPLGVINVHPSLLPKYRGATPTFWVLINGEKETGVTVHFIEDEKIDSGRIITSSAVTVGTDDDDGSLRLKLAGLTEKILPGAIELVMRNERRFFPRQDENEATFYPRRTLEDAQIDPSRPLGETINRIRAASPYPGAYLDYEGGRYRVSGARLVPAEEEVPHAHDNSTEIFVRSPQGIIQFSIVAG